MKALATAAITLLPCLALAQAAPSVMAEAAALLKSGTRHFCIALAAENDVARREALVKARILEPSAPYPLTDYGWEQLDFEDETCLPGGEVQVQIRGLGGTPGVRQPLHFGRAFVQAAPDRLAAWLKAAPDAQQLPEVRAALAGMEMDVLFRPDAERLELGAARNGLRVIEVPSPAPFGLDAIRRHPRPDKNAIAAKWREHHGRWMAPCLHITSDSSFPADETLGWWQEGFSVAVYEMLERDPKQQKVLDVTVPRLEALERAGVLVSREVRGPRYRNGRLPGRAYEIAPRYREAWIEGCLSVGTEELQVTALKFRHASARYLLRRKLTTLQPWARDAALLQALPDLRQLVDEGRVCDGEMIAATNEGWQFSSGGCR